MSQIEILLNGEQRNIASRNVADLLGELSLGGKKVAVELNRSIVRRDQYAATSIAEGDQLEIIHFVGGG